MSNFSYVIDSTFQPFSMQEMLVPFTAYKDSFEKTEEAYNDLSDKSDKFKYLSETLPEGSKARDIYEGYANNLKAQAEDLAHNGLTMGNNRALTSLKRRYQGEIGRLVKADEAMAEEKKLRQAMGAQDSSRLYATDNLNIDDFLDGKSPNLYSISGKEAYSRGAAAGKAFSSRVVNVGEGNITLGGYYRDLVTKYGYSPEVLNNFMSNMDAIPELKASFENYMESSGANANLSGVNKQRFAKEYLSGVLDGAVYQENHSPQRDLGRIDAATQSQLDLQRRGQNISLASQGLTYNDKTGTVSYDPLKDPALQKAAKIAEAKAAGKGGSSSGRGTAYDVRNKAVTMVGATTGTKYKNTKDGDNVIGVPLENRGARALSLQEYSALVDNQGNITNAHLRNAIGNGNISDYEIYIIPKGSTKIDGSGYVWDDKTEEDIYIAIPRDSKRAATEIGNISSSTFSEGTNDIPG